MADIIVTVILYLLSNKHENRKILRDARKTLSETKNLQILKSNK